MLHTQTASKVDFSQLYLIGKFVQFLTKYQPENKELITKLKTTTAIGSTGGLCSGASDSKEVQKKQM
jgi:RPA family protein